MISGLCQCGCGGIIPIAKRTLTAREQVKGQPMRFIPYHGASYACGPRHPRWNGGRTVSKGYIVVSAPTHPRADRNGYVPVHLIIAENAFGKPLPLGVEVHHVNQKRGDNRNRNLVICQDHAYHQLLHRRARALTDGGSVHNVKCLHCKQWGIPGSGDLVARSYGSYHLSCAANYKKLKRILKQEVN